MDKGLTDETLFVLNLLDRNNLKNWRNPDRNIFLIKCGTNIFFVYCIEIWSIIITEFYHRDPDNY